MIINFIPLLDNELETLIEANDNSKGKLIDIIASIKSLITYLFNLFF